MQNFMKWYKIYDSFIVYISEPLRQLLIFTFNIMNFLLKLLINFQISFEFICGSLIFKQIFMKHQIKMLVNWPNQILSTLMIRLLCACVIRLHLKRSLIGPDLIYFERILDPAGAGTSMLVCLRTICLLRTSYLNQCVQTIIQTISIRSL